MSDELRKRVKNNSQEVKLKMEELLKEQTNVRLRQGISETEEKGLG